MRKAADLSKPLQPIYRILYCGQCKNPWRMRGHIKVLKSGIKRQFVCPYCRTITKIDYFKQPTYAAIEPRENAGLCYTFGHEHWEFNKMLLEQS